MQFYKIIICFLNLQSTTASEIKLKLKVHFWLLVDVYFHTFSQELYWSDVTGFVGVDVIEGLVKLRFIIVKTYEQKKAVNESSVSLE